MGLPLEKSLEPSSKQMKAYYKDVGLGVLCKLVGRTRQAFYEDRNRAERTRFEDAIILDLVRTERRIAKRVGSKKLHLILKDNLIAHGIKIGQLFSVVEFATLPEKFP